jgi:ERF superfamily
MSSVPLHPMPVQFETRQPEVSPPPKNLARKLSNIMGKLGRVPKRGHNSFFGYDYPLESDINEAIRTLLAEEHIFIFPGFAGPEAVTTGQPFKTMSGSLQWITTIWMTFTFVDAESGESWTGRSIGQGQDGGDKGVYKAMTGCLKFFLMKTFLFSTGDDPENTQGNTDRAADNGDAREQRQSAAKRATPEPQAAPKADPGELGIISGTVEKVQKTTAKKSGKEYLELYIAGVRYSTFDQALFALLLAGAGKPVRLRVESVERSGKQFHNILEVLGPVAVAQPAPAAPAAEPAPRAEDNFHDGPWMDEPGQPTFEEREAARQNGQYITPAKVAMLLQVAGKLGYTSPTLAAVLAKFGNSDINKLPNDDRVVDQLLKYLAENKRK